MKWNNIHKLLCPLCSAQLTMAGLTAMKCSNSKCTFYIRNEKFNRMKGIPPSHNWKGAKFKQLT